MKDTIEANKVRMIELLQDSKDNPENTGKNLDEFKSLENENNELTLKLNNEKMDKNFNIKNGEAKRFDLAKAIRQHFQGGLNGLELEMHQEGVKQFGGKTNGGLLLPTFLFASEDTTTGANHLPKDVIGIDIIAPKALYKELGATVWNLTTPLTMNFGDGEDASFVGEKSALVESNPSKGSAEIKNKRVGGWRPFTEEYLSSSAVMNSVFADMVESIDRAISAKMFDEAVKASILAGRGAADVAADVAYSDIQALQSPLEESAFARPAFVASKPLYHVMEGKSIDAGSGRFIVNDGKIKDYTAYGTNLLPGTDATHMDLVYGDWKRAYVNLGSAVELLVDNITGAATGEQKIYFTRLADVKVNPNAFRSIRNAK